MGFQIEDGTGTGYTVAVNTKNKLETIAITSSIEHYTNHNEGESYNLLFQQTPAYSDPSEATGDICFLYVENTNTLDMVIEGINLRLAGSGQSEIIKIIAEPTGTPIRGNTVTPANLNLGSGKIADGTFLTGTEITGLSGGTEIYRIYIGSSNTSSNFNFEQDIIVPKNNIIALYASNLNIEIDGFLIFNYHFAEIG